VDIQSECLDIVLANFVTNILLLLRSANFIAQSLFSLLASSGALTMSH
jgi:hypothetical protein